MEVAEIEGNGGFRYLDPSDSPYLFFEEILHYGGGRLALPVYMTESVS
jgi:hypothetical protein